jgi:hypothetical protein
MFKTIHCILVLNFKLYFLQKLLFCVLVSTLVANVSEVIDWQPFGKCVRGNWLTTLWQMCYRVRGYWNPFANLFYDLEGIGKPSDKFLIVCATFANSTYLSKGCQYPLIFASGNWLPSGAVCRGYWISFWETYTVGMPINKERVNLFVITLF